MLTDPPEAPGDIDRGMQRVPAFEESPAVDGTVQAVTYGGDCLILGTDTGAITAFAWENEKWSPTVSCQTKKDLPVAKLVALAGVNRLMAMTASRTVAGYLLNTLEPFSKLSMRDVTQVVLEVSSDPSKPRQQTAIFTSSAIRFLDITQDTVKVARSIDYPGIVDGRWADTKLLLATKDTYELLDLSKDSKIPLFPVAPELHPILGVVGKNEFLVVQGTAADEVAMGLIVTDEGEVARQGDVIMWDAYPSQAIVVLGTHLLSVVNGQLLVHRLQTKIELVEHDFGDRVVAKIFDTTGPMLFDAKISSKVGQRCLSRAEALILYENGSMDWWVPPSSFSALETLILEGETEELVAGAINVTGEQGVWELEYLSLLLGLHFLTTKQYTKAVGAWLDGVRLDPGIVLYLFGDQDALSVPPGLVDMAKELRVDLAADTQSSKFYRTWLRAQIKRTTDSDLLLKLEQVYAGMLQGPALLEFVSKQATASFDSLAQSYREKGQYDILEQIYDEKNDTAQLVELWTAALAGSIALDKPRSAAKLANLLMKSDDKAFVWTQTLKLVEFDADAGIAVFKHGKARFDDQKILDALKQQGGELAWRSYLRYLVYEVKNPSFTADLTTIIATDLVQGYRDAQISKFVDGIYAKYRSLPQPKRPFCRYLETRQRKVPAESPEGNFLQLELDFWALISRPEADLASLTVLLDENAPELVIERSAIYSFLGLHSQCIELLDGINDYESLLCYSEYGRPAPPSNVVLEKLGPRLQLDLTRQIFRQLVRGSQPPGLVGDFLRRKKFEIPLELALEHLPSEWPASEFTEFFAYHVSGLSSRKRQSMLQRAVAKRENLVVAGELERRAVKE